MIARELNESCLFISKIKGTHIPSRPGEEKNPPALLKKECPFYSVIKVAFIFLGRLYSFSNFPVTSFISLAFLTTFKCEGHYHGDFGSPQCPLLTIWRNQR